MGAATREQAQRILRGRSLNEIGRAMRIDAKKRGANPIEEGRADIVPWILYDRQFTAAGSTTSVEYDYFTTPIGGAKTKQDTNMEQVSVLPNPQHFNVTSMQFYFSSQMLLTDISKFLDTYYTEFWITGKNYAEGPLSMFPGGGGVTGFSTQTGVGAFSNGFPSPLAVVDFRQGTDPIGHHILQGQTFKVKVLTSAGFATQSASPVGLSLLVVLEGILSRQVQ